MSMLQLWSRLGLTQRSSWRMSSHFDLNQRNGAQIKTVSLFVSVDAISSTWLHCCIVGASTAKRSKRIMSPQSPPPIPSQPWDVASQVGFICIHLALHVNSRLGKTSVVVQIANCVISFSSIFRFKPFDMLLGDLGLDIQVGKPCSIIFCSWQLLDFWKRKGKKHNLRPCLLCRRPSAHDRCCEVGIACWAPNEHPRHEQDCAWSIALSDKREFLFVWNSCCVENKLQTTNWLDCLC